MQLASYAGYFLGRTLASYLARPDFPLPLPIASKLPARWDCASEIRVCLDEINKKVSSGGFLVQRAPPSPTDVSEGEDIQYFLDGNSTFTAPFAHNNDFFFELPRPQENH
ncbi:hypothetical protein Vi05172_g7306 [Venturia inaequalis]|nr:hypothetical protein Vi05172_g7306 [Venturia inaequalis]